MNHLALLIDMVLRAAMVEDGLKLFLMAPTISGNRATVAIIPAEFCHNSQKKMKRTYSCSPDAASLLSAR